MECASKLGIDLAELVHTNAAGPGCGGVFLPRRLNGIPFFDETEGFQIMFGRDGKVLQFCLLWPRLERDENSATARPGEIIQCIKGHKSVLVPEADARDYFQQVKEVARARKLTITQVTPYYGEGRLGEEPKDSEPAEYVGPMAILVATAESSTNAVFVRLYAPILSSDVRRLLAGTSTSSTPPPQRRGARQ